MPYGGHKTVLVVRRTVGGDAAIFHHTKLEQVEHLKILFSTGVASPNDVHYETGVTALDVFIP